MSTLPRQGQCQPLPPHHTNDAWRDFTGLRNELNYLITPTGVRLLGTIKKPMTIEEVYKAKNS